MPTEIQAIRWSSIFRRWQYSPNVYGVAPAWDQRAWKELDNAGLSSAGGQELIGTILWSSYHSTVACAVLDGFVFKVSKAWRLPVYGDLGRGSKVIGNRSLRLICHLLGVAQPRKLKGESAVPSVEQLLADLAQQQALGREALERLAERATGFRTRYDLIELAASVGRESEAATQSTADGLAK